MALNATIYKAELQVSDMDRHYYATHALTLARHPSETEERLMVRLLAFALHADERLEFGRGLSDEDEPALWRRYWHDGVALLRLFINCALPAALAEHRIRIAKAAPVLSERDDGRHYTLTLGGTWHDAVLAELRAAMSRATAQRRQIHVELLADCRLDSAALGLLLLLYGHQSKVGAALTAHTESAAPFIAPT